ncbi:MAG: hypothetical protein HY904_15760 [Deltaproteobacteria bacterium]|nr:hypothetical protein [Deltaproteobacteria bacterium]
MEGNRWQALGQCLAVAWLAGGCVGGLTRDAGVSEADAATTGSSGGSSSSGAASSSSSSSGATGRDAGAPDAGPAVIGLCASGNVDAGARDAAACGPTSPGMAKALVAWGRSGATQVWVRDPADGGWTAGAALAEPFERVLLWNPEGDYSVVESAAGARMVRISDGALLSRFFEPSWRYRAFAATPPGGWDGPWLCALAAQTDLADALLEMRCATAPGDGGVIETAVPLGNGQVRYRGALGVPSGHIVFAVRRPLADGGFHDELLRRSPLVGYNDTLVDSATYAHGSFDDWQGLLVSGVTGPRLDGGSAGDWVVASNVTQNVVVAARAGTLASGPWSAEEGAFSADHALVVVVDPDGTVRAWQTIGGATDTTVVGHAGAEVHAASARGGVAVVGLRPVVSAVVLLAGDGTIRSVVDDRDCALGGTMVKLRPLGLNPWGEDVFLQRSEVFADGGEQPRGLSLVHGNGCRLDFGDGRTSTNDPRLFTAAAATGRGVYFWDHEAGTVELLGQLPAPDMDVFLVQPRW